MENFECLGKKLNFTLQNMRVCVLSCVPLFATLGTIACQAPLSMGFSSKNTRGVAVSSSRRSSQPRDWICISYIGRCILLPLSHLGSMKPEIFSKMFKTSSETMKITFLDGWSVGRQVKILWQKTLNISTVNEPSRDLMCQNVQETKNSLSFILTVDLCPGK